ncbi:MAG: hypothetical protein KAT43_00640 [Nanoarchaeota archaeon]|nr:hypothetical protein [Nanoarchaeota archaeon]
MPAITSRRIGVKKKDRKFLLSGFIVFLMVLSVLGYAAYSGDGESYNGHTFEFRESYWNTKIDKTLFQFHFLPDAVKTIELLGNLRYEEYFLVHDSSINLSAQESSAIYLVKYELYLQMTEKLGIPVELATSNPTNTSTMPISCTDATLFIGVIEYSYGNETKIINENNCIKVIAESDSMLVKANDRLLYTLLEII